MAAKILLLDIETAPSLGWVWGKWQQDVIDFEDHWYLLSFAYKWLGEDVIHARALPDFANYSADPTNDFDLCSQLWDVLDEADIVVAHNGDGFDLKKSNARFIAHKMPPPSTYKSVDTLKVARKHFRFESNKLNDLGQYLECGAKVPHTGFSLWRGCMAGDPRSWELMIEYNKQDVALLEQVYLKLRPWAVSHPNLNLYSEHPHQEENCPTCQSSHIQRRGFSYTKMYVRQRFQCTDCGTWFSGKTIKQAEKAERKKSKDDG